MKNNKGKVLNNRKGIIISMKRGKIMSSEKRNEYIKYLKNTLKDKQIMKELKTFVKITT